ncbi:MAG TPA: nucleoside deaminase [Blattabacteriaceae bacterium]
MIFSPDFYFMNIALKEAKCAFEKDEVPIGAVIVRNGKIITKAHNLVERLSNVTAHAEMQSIILASKIEGKYLQKCTIYVTLEPCFMCTGALFWAKIKRVVFGARKMINERHLLHPRTRITKGIMEKECKDILQKFFRTKRKNNLVT